MSGVFLVKHHNGKKKEEIQKTKLPKHVGKKLFLKKTLQKETEKKGDFLWDKKTKKRDFHSITESCRQRKTQEEKWTKK